MTRVLLIEDDRALCVLLKKFLALNDIELEYVHNGKEALSCLISSGFSCYNLLILDIMLPKVNGFELLAEVRRRSVDIPIIMLTGRGAPEDKVLALTSGADDYVCKPCNPRELVARIFAVLRRAGGRQTQLEASQNIFRLGDVEVDRDSRNVRVADVDLVVTDVEFRLLDILLRNVGEIVSSEQLFNEVLGRDYDPDDRSLTSSLSEIHFIQKVLRTLSRLRTEKASSFYSCFGFSCSIGSAHAAASGSMPCKPAPILL